MKPDKNQMKVLKMIADRIDEIAIEQHGRKLLYATVENQKVSHDDMELANQEYDPEQEYTMKMPVYHECNQFRRLKRVFKSNGINGVVEYLENMKLQIDADQIRLALIAPKL